MDEVTVRQAREAANQRQEDLARATGINQSTISRIENGEIQQPRKRTMRKLARALGVPVERLTVGRPEQVA